jgi:hypothetical protein
MNNNKRNKPDHDSSPETEQKLCREGTQVDRTQLKQEKNRGPKHGGNQANTARL